MSKTPICPRCERTHAANDVRAVDPFGLRGEHGFRANYDGAPARATREQCEADMCAWRIRQRLVDFALLASAPPVVAEPLTHTAPEPPPVAVPQPFPVVEIERLARERAWQKFLAEATVSLTVWTLDEHLHAALASPVDWLRECAADLAALVNRQAVTG